jgi:hypothetical protein
MEGYALRYPDAVADDGGICRYVVGDRVQLYERDTATPRTQDLVIDAIDTGAGTITFTDPVSAEMETAITSGAPVDLRYSRYSTSGLQDGQKDYCWIGDALTRVIDGTADPVFVFAP